MPEPRQPRAPGAPRPPAGEPPANAPTSSTSPATAGDQGEESMTVRDEFAARILSGILAGRKGGLEQMDQNKIARRAYQFADAMMQARMPNDDQGEDEQQE